MSKGLVRLDLQHGEIQPVVLEHDLAREFPAVGQRHLDVVGAGDDVVVGHDDAVLADDDAGAERRLLLRAVRHLLAEELLEEGSSAKGERRSTVFSA